MQRGAFYNPGMGAIHLAGLQCTGTESRITQCPAGSTDGCVHMNDAGVACRPSKSFNHDTYVYCTACHQRLL